MKKIIVNISWQENYGASSEDVPGCVALHDTLEGVREAYRSALAFYIEGLAQDEMPQALKGDYELAFILDVHALLNHYKV